jgi:hypothetical protein
VSPSKTEAARGPQALLLDSDDGFAHWCAAHRGGRLRLWLPARRLHLATLDPALPLAPAAWGAHARNLFGHYLGATASQAPMALWASGGRRGACLAVDLDLVALQQQARLHRVRLLSVQPLWAGLLAEAMTLQPVLREAAPAQLLVVEADRATLLTLQAGRVQQVQPLRLANHSAQALADALVEEGLGTTTDTLFAIGHGLGEPLESPPWQALGDLQAPPDALPRHLPRQAFQRGPELQAIDAGRQPSAGLHRWGWGLAGTALLVLATAASTRWEAHQALHRPKPVLRAATPRPAPPDPVVLGAQVRLAQQLQHPWPALLSAVEAAAGPGLLWQSLEHGSDRTELRLAGQASGAGQVHAAAAHLGTQPAWTEVLVSRLRPLPHGGVGFEISARLEPRR